MEPMPSFVGEEGYLKLVDRILTHGVLRSNRTGTPAYSIFGASLSFDLKEGFPLLTTKRMATKSIVHELLWFIGGKTDANILTEQGVPIWKGNSSREFLDQRGLTNYRPGDCGPIYGFQWRHSGAQYVECDTDYTDQGIDQLQGIIDQLKKDPTDRRMVMCSWNPSDLSKMALPPCHILVQFYVDVNKELHATMYQRSADMGLGVPFNIASYALLMHIVGQRTGFLPARLNLVFGDCHIYKDHEGPLRQQLLREVKKPPYLLMASEPKTVEGYRFSDFVFLDYNPDSPISMKMAV